MDGLDPELWSITWLSLRISATALLVSSLVGLPLGASLGLSRFRGKSAVFVLVHTMMGLPPVIVGLLVYLLLSHSGPLATLDWLFTPKAMILAQTVLALPFIVGITMTSVASLPPELLLQVRSLGAGPWQARWTMLRESRRGLVLAIAAAFGRSISEVGAVLIVGGNIRGDTRVLTTAIILETGKGRFAFALALGACLLTLALLVNLLIFALQGRPAP